MVVGRGAIWYVGNRMILISALASGKESLHRRRSCYRKGLTSRCQNVDRFGKANINQCWR